MTAPYRATTRPPALPARTPRPWTQLKMAHGEDLIRANPKGEHPFFFYNTALFVQMANRLPLVTDTSGAFIDRTLPILFPHSKSGRENWGLGATLDAERAGHLNRLIGAWRARQARENQSFLPAHPDVLADFMSRTNPVSSFWESCVTQAPHDVFTGARTVPATWLVTRTQLYKAYTEYCAASGRRSLGWDNFLDAVTSAPYHLRKARTTGNREGYACRLHAVDTKPTKISTTSGTDVWVTPDGAWHVRDPEAGTSHPDGDGGATSKREPTPQPDAPTSTSRGHPALSRLTPEFYALLLARGERIGGPEPLEDDTAYVQRALGVLAGIPATVTLPEIAEALAMPELHARAYLRAVGSCLAAAGFLVRERRLRRPGGPESRYIPEFVPPDERLRLREAAKSAKAEAAVAAAVVRAAKDRATPEQLRCAADLARAAEDAAVEVTHLDCLPESCTAYAVLLHPDAYDTATTGRQEDRTA